MPFRLSHWLAVVAFSLALVAAWQLPLDSARPGSPRVYTDAENRYGDLSRELHNARTLLDQMRREGRLPARAVSSAERGIAVILSEESSLPPETLAALRERIEREATAVGPMEPGIVVGYGYDGSDGGETGLTVAEAHRPETYVGEQDGTAFCLQVLVTRPARFEFVAEEDLDGRGWSRSTQSLLGPCAFYAAYGPAGAGIQAWLEAGGSNFAFGHPFGPAPAQQYLRPRRPWLFGIGSRQLVGSTPVGRCVAGDSEGCALAFLEPWSARVLGTRRLEQPEYAATFTGTGRSGPFPTTDWFLLADVESEFGTEAFQRFWGAEGDVRTAFESAFQVDLGAWLLQWIAQDVDLERSSPSPSLPVTFGGLLFVALMTGFATVRQRRRTVS